MNPDYSIETSLQEAGLITTENRLRISDQDQEDLAEFVKQGLYINVPDAGRDAIRRGIEDIKNRRSKKRKKEE